MYTEGNSKSFFSRQALKIRKNILIYQVLKKGDHNAFGQLYDLYVSQIFRFIFFKVLRREEAEDLTAETFLKMWEYLVAQGAKKREIGNFQALIGKPLPLRGPFDISGRLTDPAPKVFRVTDLKATLGESEFNGSLEINLTGPRPQLSIQGSSKKINL